MNIDTLISHQQIIILRRSDKSFEETFNDTGFLLEDAIEENEIPYMSMNLMGSFYKSPFIKFKPKMKTRATEVWQGGISILLSDYLNDYEELDIYTPIYFNVADLHNQQLPSYREINNESRNLMKSLKIKNPIQEDGKFVLMHNSVIEHTPLNLNYWHVELVIYDYKTPSKPLKKLNELNKSAVGYMLSHILTFKASAKEPQNIIPLAKNFYS